MKGLPSIQKSFPNKSTIPVSWLSIVPWPKLGLSVIKQPTEALHQGGQANTQIVK